MLPLAGIIMSFMMGSQFGTIFGLAIQEKTVIFLLILQWIVTLPLALFLAYKLEFEVQGFFLA